MGYMKKKTGKNTSQTPYFRFLLYYVRASTIYMITLIFSSSSLIKFFNVKLH